MKDYIKTYNSLNALANDIQGREIDTYYNAKYALKNAPEYPENVRLMLEGDPESARLVSESLGKEKMKVNRQENRNTVYSAQLGFTPNMGRVMSGHPENMLNIRRETYKNSKVINIIYNCAVSCQITDQDLAAQGARLLSEIQRLEKAGYRVNLYVSSIASHEGSKNKDLVAVKIKDSGKPFNITRLAFPLVNPNFLRSIVLAWYETTGCTRDYNYGIPLWANNAVDFIREQKQFNGYYYTDYYILSDNADKPVADILEMYQI